MYEFAFLGSKCVFKKSFFQLFSRHQVGLKIKKNLESDTN